MDLRDEIEKVAYELFEKDGRQHGKDKEHWLEAERIVRERHGAEQKKAASGAARKMEAGPKSAKAATEPKPVKATTKKVPATRGQEAVSRAPSPAGGLAKPAPRKGAK
jgi:hypothetical protein